MKSRYNEYILRKCTVQDVSQIFELQEIIIDELDNKELLRQNERRMFEHCVQEPNLTVGIYDKEELIAVAIFVVEHGEEDLSLGLICHDVNLSANLKLVMVKKAYRGNGFQRALMWILEKYAYTNGFTHLCTAVSEKNIYSLHNVKEAGYEYDHNAVKYGGLSRCVFVKDIRQSVSPYNKMILKVIGSLENKSEPNALIEEGIDLNKCFQGELSFASTGDILEYQDLDSGKVYYGLLIKKITWMVLIYISEYNRLQLVDFSYNINRLKFQKVLINTGSVK